MSDQKKNLSPDGALAHFSRSIGHPARIAVLVAVARKKGDVIGEVIQVPTMAPATVIQHLRELKRAGLIKGRIFGVQSKYGIDWDNLSKFKNEFESFLMVLESDGEVK